MWQSRLISVMIRYFRYKLLCKLWRQSSMIEIAVCKSHVADGIYDDN